MLKAKGWKQKALLSPSCTVKTPNEFWCTQLLLYKGTPSLSHRLLGRRCHCLQSLHRDCAAAGPCPVHSCTPQTMGSFVCAKFLEAPTMRDSQVSTRCCCSWVWMKTLCLSSVHCSQKLREMLWSCFFHMSPLLSHFWAREWEKMFCENHWNEDYRGRKYVRSTTITLCAGFTYSKEVKGLDQGNRAEHQKHPGRCAQRWDVFLQAAALLGMRWLWNRAWIYPTFLAQSDAFISLFRQMRVGVTFQIPPVWRGVSGVQK